MKLFGQNSRLHSCRVAFAIICGLAVIFSTLPVFQGPSHQHASHHHHGDEVILALEDGKTGGDNKAPQEHSHIGAHEHNQGFLMPSGASYSSPSLNNRWLAFTHEASARDFRDRLERPPRSIA